MTRPVIVEPYNPDWRRLYEKEASHLTQVFHPYPIVNHHIGSTSVEGLSAKPTIDILIEVGMLDHAEIRAAALEKAGYTAKGENGIKGRRFFVKNDGPHHLVHLHVYQEGSHEVIRHLAFRDYLQTHPEMAVFYGHLKTDLAAHFPEDIDSYITGKDEAIKRIETEALNWWYSYE